jgi:hypothetical protein
MQKLLPPRSPMHLDDGTPIMVLSHPRRLLQSLGLFATTEEYAVGAMMAEAYPGVDAFHRG